MPTLVVEHAGIRRGGVIPDRVLIGRLPTSGIVVNEAAVSRLHAWIARSSDGSYFIHDCGSRTGTFVNGQPVERQATLRDGDFIKIGTARLAFRTANTLPAGFTPVDLRGRPPSTNIILAGILFDCVCGAPHWAKATSVNQPYECDHCGRSISVPSKPSTVARVLSDDNVPTEQPDPPTTANPSTTASESPPPPISNFKSQISNPSPPPPPPEIFCSICHSLIAAGEPTHECTSCHLKFHEECWLSNHGCSAYGCPQVGILSPPEPAQSAPIPAAASPLDYLSQSSMLREEPRPWEYILLALAVVGTLAGAFIYGLTAALAATGSLVYLARSPRSRRTAILWSAVILSLLGFLGGIIVSRYYWHTLPLGKGGQP